MCFMGSITLNPHSDFHEVGVLLPHLTDEDAKAQRGEVIMPEVTQLSTQWSRDSNQYSLVTKSSPTHFSTEWAVL